MRHRFSVALYDDLAMDAELLDYIFGHDKYKRSDVMRTLLRVGYSTLVKHNSDVNDIMVGSVDPDAIRIIMNALGKKGGVEAAHKAIERNKNQSDVENKELDVPNKLTIPVEKRRFHAAKTRKRKVVVEATPAPATHIQQQTVVPDPEIKKKEAPEPPPIKDSAAPQFDMQELIEMEFKRPDDDDDEEYLYVDPSIVESEKDDDDDFTDPMAKLGRYF
ncbi:hypothetical protein D3C87_378550 [compost metagenome]